MKAALFDLSGTVVQYGKAKAMPLMKDLLNSLDAQGWKIFIISRWAPNQIATLLEKAQVGGQYSIVSSQGLEKGATVARVLNAASYEESIFVDDKPENLASVLEACGRQTRIIGFVGSRRYTPQLARWCQRNEIELALSPPDLSEGLLVPIEAYEVLFNSVDTWEESELVSLIAGLDHPCSSITGETAYFDHRAVIAELLDNRRPEDYARLWSNIAWITCNECLWKALVRTVLLSSSLDLPQVLGGTYKHDEYTKALKDWVKQNPGSALREHFQRALRFMQQGIEEIGLEAETCRIADRPIERDRIKIVAQRVQEVFG